MDEFDKIPGCFKNATPSLLARIKEMINDETMAARYYAMLARRDYNRGAATLLRTLAEDERRHAKNFSAVYYIFTNDVYKAQADTPNIPPYKQALQERYNAEKRDAAAYMRLAQNTKDPCLRSLYLEVSHQEDIHAQELGKLLERVK